ncbi:MAG: DUF533 domain-containing protein [Gammaproteobacteria bacterium]
MSMTSMLGKMIVAGLVAKGTKKLMGGGRSSGGGGGGVSDLLGGLLKGKQTGGGGLGGLLSGLAGGAAAKQSGGIGDILGAFLDKQQAPQAQPSASQNQQAEVLLTAMLNAIKSDGQIDKAEQDRIVQQLGEVSDDEARFVQSVMTAPLDVNAFIRSVPKGMEQQVYLMSLTSIDLDSKAEAQYLHKLAEGLGISQQACNQIHEQVGAPQLYS